MRVAAKFWGGRRLVLWVLLALGLLFPAHLGAQELVVIGASEEQEQLIACIVRSATEKLSRTAASDTPLVFVLLDHKKFLEARHTFRAWKTEHAFSNLATRRVYLSSYAFADFDMAVHYVAHELGHFETNSISERDAELRASPIKRKARAACR